MFLVNQLRQLGQLGQLGKRASVLKFAKFGAPARSMADIGCGSGFYSLMAKRAGLKVCAVDICKVAIEKVRPFVDEARVMDLHRLQLSEKFDIVLSRGAFDSARRPRMAIQNLAEIVAPGGRLVVRLTSSERLRGIVKNGRESGLVLSASERIFPWGLALLFNKLR